MEYKDAGFDEHQMREIRLGFQNGLTDEQVAVYSNEGLEWEQLEKRLSEQVGEK